MNEVRKIYKESGLTYRKISEKTGIPIDTLMSWSQGRRKPPAYVINYLKIKMGEKNEEE